MNGSLGNVRTSEGTGKYFVDAIEPIRNLLPHRQVRLHRDDDGRRLSQDARHRDEVSSSSRRSVELRTAATFWTRRAADDERGAIVPT